MVRTIIDGQKAGEGSAKQPEIAPDSARSVTKLKQVIGLSEGEIGGFDKSDIKLENTPLSELSPEIICSYRFGTLNQEYIEGVDEVANEIAVGVELRGDLDWVKLITNTDIDHVGIRLRWGPLQTSHSNGDVSGVSISYQILIAPVGGAYEAVLVTTLSDKTSDSYERYHEFKLPSSDDGWMVKVVRTTPSAQSSLVSDKMYVQAYAEIIKSKFTFPYTSLIYLEYDARSFSNVAKLAVNAKGMIIKVPSNYDPVTRQYTGLWNGSFKMAYSNNPAWIYYDLVTQRRYGCGDRIDSSMVDKWSLYRLAQYCDQMVPDGYGGQEPRFTCNVYLQSKERVYDILNRLTGLFRAINFWNGSQLVVDADIPQDSSYLYTNANVVDGLFEYAGTAATDLYSAAKVAWDNPANGYNTEYEPVSYEHLVKKLGFKVLELDAWGCTSRGQALRAGRWALLAESDTITFKVGMDGYLAMPGKIIEVQDEFYAGKSNGGRVISISESGLEITLDRPVETIAGDTISFNTVFGSVQKFDIVSSAGSVVTLATPVGSSIERMHIWAINSSQLATQKYRILTVKYDGVGEFTISAVEYNPNKYEEIDSNIVFDEPPTSIINPVAQIAVKNVTISSNEYVYQGLNTVNLEIKWERAENAVEYLVEFKKDDGSWIKLPSTGNSSIILENAYAGNYIAKVTAVSAYELKSLPTYSVKTNVLGKQSTPLPPLNPRVQPIQFGIEFYWDFPQGSSDTAVSRIAVSYLDPTGLVDESGLLIYDKAYSDNKVVIQNLDLHTRVWFKVKLIDKLGFESPYTDWVSGLPSQDIDKVMDLISGYIEQSDLSQTLSERIDTGVEASAAAEAAQNAANNAQSAANTAQLAAQQAQDTANSIEIDLRNEINGIGNGLTQETQQRVAGDEQITSNLTAYKESNNSALAVVAQTAQSAVTANEATAQQVSLVTATVNTKNRTYRQDTVPTDNLVIGDIWINTASGANNEQRRFNGASWDVITDPRTAQNASGLSSLNAQFTDLDNQQTATAQDLVNLNANVNNLTNTVGNKADQSAVDTLQVEVSNQGSTITSHGSQLLALNGSVTTLEGEVQQKADNSVVQNISNELVATNSTVSNHTQQLSALETSYSNIAVGGTNLLRNTAKLSNPEKYKGFGVDVVTIDSGTENIDAFYAGSVGHAGDPINATDYVLSFDAMASVEGASMIAYFYSPNNTTRVETSQGYISANADGNAEFHLTTQMQRYWVKWRQTPNSGTKGIIAGRIYSHGVTTTFKMARAKFEVGTVPTDYSESPLDVAGSINANTSAINVTQSNLDVTNNTVAGIASDTNALKVNVRAITASDNLIPNPTFDSIYDRMGFTVLDSFAPEVPANCPYRFVAKLTNRDNIPNIDDIPCKEGDVYEVSAYVASNVGTHSLSLMMFAKDGKDMNIVDFPAGGYVDTPSAWVKTTWRWTVGTGVRFFRPILQLDQFDQSSVWYVANWTVTNVSAAAKAQAIADAAAAATNSLTATVTQHGNDIQINSSQLLNLDAALKSTPVSGGNLLRNGDFSLNDMSYWGTRGEQSGATANVLQAGELDSWQAHAGSSKTVYMHVTGTRSTYFEIYQSVQVIQNKIYQLSAYTGVHRGTAKIFAYFIAADGSSLGNTFANVDSNASNTINNGGNHLAGYKRIFQNVTAPANCATIEFVLRVESVEDTYLFATRAMLAEIESTVATVVPWADSSGATTERTLSQATLIQQNTAKVNEVDGKVEAQSSQLTTISTTVGNNTASINSHSTSIDGLNAKSTLQVVAGNTIGGVAIGNNGGVVDFVIRANNFAIAPPIGYEGSSNYAFVYQTTPTTLPNGTVIPAGLKVSDAIIGSIDASKIHADSLSAISANLGSIKVDTAHIEDAAVTTAKIADLAVDTLKIKGNSVTVPTVAYTIAAIQVSSAWTTIQSIAAQSSLGLTLFNFNWLYASTRSDTQYIVNYRILKNGVIVVESSRIFFFEVNFSNNSAKASPSGTLSLNYSDASLVDGTYQLQVQLSAGSNMNFLNRYASALVVRR